jgi:hypothetical protein
MGSRRNSPRWHGASRQYQTRPTLPIMVVVCDDAKTAVAYFTELKDELKAKVTVKVVPAPHDGASPDAVISLAIAHAERLLGNESHDAADEDESIWALIDLESEPLRQKQAHAAKKKAMKSRVGVALSQPCFEIWTLAHLIDSGEAFENCGAVVGRIRREWKRLFSGVFANKAQADYAKLMQYRKDAVQRCKKRNAINDQSWSEVYKVVEAIERLASAQ